MALDISGFTEADVQKALANISLLPRNEQIQLLAELEELEKTRSLDLRQNKFLEFVKHVYPGYKVGAHHKRLAQIFEDIANGKKKRVIVNIAPRHGKSELISYLAPAWFLGKYPHKKIIMASHTADLAVNFGRRVRNLVGSDAYSDIFPDVEYREYFRELRAYHVMNGMILSHIPIHEGSLGRFGVNIHGHTHTNRVMGYSMDLDKEVIDPRYHCVCVEQTDFAPILFEDVLKRITAEGGTVGFRNGNGPTM